jgi:hypothetical protein
VVEVVVAVALAIIAYRFPPPDDGFDPILR